MRTSQYMAMEYLICANLFYSGNGCFCRTKGSCWAAGSEVVSPISHKPVTSSTITLVKNQVRIVCT